MGQKALAKWLKAILVGVGICGLIVYFLILFLSHIKSMEILINKGFSRTK